METESLPPAPAPVSPTTPEPRTPPVPRMGRGRIFFIGLGLGFISGAAALSYFTTDWWQRDTPPCPAPSGPPPDPVQVRLQDWEAQLVRELALTADQQRAVHEECGYTLAAATDLRAQAGGQSLELSRDLLERIARRLPATKEPVLRALMRRGFGQTPLVDVPPAPAPGMPSPQSKPTDAP